MVYKYFPPDRATFFQDLLISFSPPALLRDPRECIPTFDSSDWDGQVERVVERNLDRIALTRGSPLIPDPIQQAAQVVKHSYKNDSESVKRRILDLVKQNTNREVGILCLSADPDIELMWDKYGCGHEGFVIGLDDSNEFFTRRATDPPDCGILRAMNYTDASFKIRLDDATLRDDLVFSKKASYSHEKEVRMIRPLRNADTIKTSGGKTLHLFRIPSEAVVEVIFGVRCAAATAHSIRSSVATNGSLNHVRFSRAEYGTDGIFRFLPL